MILYNTVIIVNIAVLYYNKNMAETTTLEKIHKIAIEEFLQNGFRGASLREIVKKAGVTTGAFYGYYKSKEELFDAIVQPHAEYIRNCFDKCIKDFLSVPKEEWSQHMSDFSENGMAAMFDYAFEHKDSFRLILNASEGTRWENYIHDLVETEIEITHKYYDVIREQGFKPHSLPSMLEHMIISGEFTGLFEVIIHDIPKEEAMLCVKELHDFYEGAWAKLLGL